MSKYTEIYITDGVTEKRRLFDFSDAENLSVNEVVHLLNFESDKPVWHYFILMKQVEAHMRNLSSNKDGLSGEVFVNGKIIKVEPFDDQEVIGMVGALKVRAVRQYLAGEQA